MSCFENHLFPFSMHPFMWYLIRYIDGTTAIAEAKSSMCEMLHMLVLWVLYTKRENFAFACTCTCICKIYREEYGLNPVYSLGTVVRMNEPTYERTNERNITNINLLNEVCINSSTSLHFHFCVSSVTNGTILFHLLLRWAWHLATLFFTFFFLVNIWVIEVFD